MSKFQVVLLTVFGIFIITAVLVFALYRGGAGGQQATVTVWGSLSAQDFNAVLYQSSLADDQAVSIKYVEKPLATLESNFVEALAEDTGPDLIILTQAQFTKNKNRLVTIPYESVSERDARSTFIEEGELFLSAEGIYALPLSIDPLVLYYNRDLLSAAGIANPIRYWDEIYESTLKLSKKDAAGNLAQSTIALGETRNIENFKEILSMLLLQAGTSITAPLGEELRSSLGYAAGTPTRPADAALDFYTQFSNPTKLYYSWNRALPDAQTHFVGADTAYYIGFASEWRTIKSKAPTLNFAVVSIPQSRVSGKSLTYGTLYGVAISRGTRNPSAALTAVLKLVSKDTAQTFSNTLLLPPARRDLLAIRPTGSEMPVFYEAALQAKAWIDPDEEGTRTIFRKMIEDVTSGRARTSEAVSAASRELDALIK